MRVVLLGYYGHRNLGDDLMMEAAAGSLAEQPHVSQVVAFTDTRGQPSRVPEPLRHPKIRIASLSGASGKARLAYQIVRSDRVLWGGGTCVYEPSDGDLSGLRFLAMLARTCKRLHRPIHFCCIGLGRLTSERAKALARQIIRDAARLVFRDEPSATDAIELGALPGQISVAGDLFFAHRHELPPPRRSHSIRTISFSGVHGFACNRRLTEQYGQMAAGWVRELGCKLLFVPMHQGASNDNEFHASIAARLPAGSWTLASYDDTEGCIRHMEKADVHVGMRLHSLALADSLAIPNVAIEYSPKVARYVSRSAMGDYPRLAQVGEEVGASRLVAALRGYAHNPHFHEAEQAAALTALTALSA